jgi:hypothetical protein
MTRKFAVVTPADMQAFIDRKQAKPSDITLNDIDRCADSIRADVPTTEDHEALLREAIEFLIAAQNKIITLEAYLFPRAVQRVERRQGDGSGPRVGFTRMGA